MKQQQARIIQKERLDAVQLLMRRIAHEINNPLGIIKNYLAILSSRAAKNISIEREISIVYEEIDRISRLLPQFTIAEAPPRNVPSPVDVNIAVRLLTEMLAKGTAADRGIELDVRLQPSLPQVWVDNDGL